MQKQAQDFCIIANQQYHRGKEGQMRIYVTEKEYVAVLAHAHSSIPGGHFSTDVTAKTIMRARLWWSTLFKDASEYVE